MRLQLRLLRASKTASTLLRVTLTSLLLCGFIQPQAYAAQVTFRWDYDASGAAGFVLYCGPSSRTYPTRVDVGNTDTHTIATLTEGATSFCAVTAYDPAKAESVYSNEISVDVPYAAPVVGFNATPISGKAPLSVAFTNTTTGQVTTWAWNFGDGYASNLQSPTHVYSTPGNYNAVLSATGAGGTTTATRVISVTTQGGTPPAPGLVAAYAFNEGAGTKAADASGNGNTGTINGATWTAQGRFGAALSFDGLSNMVQIPSSASLNLSSAMTLEAWVFPTASQSGWRTIVQRDVDAYFLHASNRNGALVPAGGGTFNGTVQWVGGTTANPVNAWTHVALTYDGATLRLYVNGVQAASQARTGAIQTNTNQVSIGGNAPWGEFFQGRIDEVRVYNRALSPTEIQTNMSTPVAPVVPDTTPPSTPAGLTATAVSGVQIDLTWSASTDNVAVTGYRVERCQGAGCSNFTLQVATPAATSFSNTGLTAGTGYSYRVRASDASGNLSGYSSVVSVVTPAPPPPPAPGLVAAYAFNEGAGTKVADASGNGNTGTINGATWTAQGRFGAALSFDGLSNMVQIPSSASLNLSSAMTLEAWVFPTASQSGWRTIVQRDVDAYFLHASNRNGALVPAGGGTFNGTVQWVGGTTANPVNAWTHVALTYDGATLRLYVNGVQAASQARTGAIQTNTNQVSIGGNAPWGEFFQGRIDEVRVYNRALSPTEIQNDMKTGVAP